VLLPKLTSTQITSVWCHDLYRLSSDVSCIYLVNGEISSICKVKVQCTLVHALRLCTGRTANRGSRNVALLFFDRGTRGGGGLAARPGRSLPPGKDPVPIVQEAGWAPGPVWTGAENLGPTRFRSPDRPARSESLYRLSYRAHVIYM